MSLYLISLNVSGLPSWSAIFIGSLITLIIASDFFIKASERIGIALGIPAFIVGVTMIAIGTSLPELVTSIVAVTRGQSVIVPGNVVGSNLTNTGLVLGVIAIIARRIKLEFDVMKVDGPMLIGATLLLFLCLLDGKFQFFEGLLFLGGLAVYLAYIFMLGKSGGDEAESLDIPSEERKHRLTWKEPVILLLSGLVIYFSAVFNVQAINNLGKILHVGQDFIALTAVALGTSLPELIVSLVAVRTGNIEMAVGNVVGSNLFNIFAVMGLPRLFGEIAIPPTLIDYSLPALVAITIVLLYVLQDKVINRWEGWILLLFYIGVMVSLVSAEVIA
ncbi:MAG: calcium/sodium antiporter [Bacteroidota bacterium]